MTDSLTIQRDSLRIQRNWTQFCAARHPLIQTKTALDRVWQSRNFFQATKLFFYFVFLLGSEVIKAPVDHTIGRYSLDPSKAYSIIQCWFFLATNGSATSLRGWVIFQSKFIIRDCIQGHRNRTFGFFKEASSWWAHLSPLSLLGIRVFLFATFSTATYASLSRPEQPLLSYTLKTEKTLENILVFKPHFRNSNFGISKVSSFFSIHLQNISNYRNLTSKQPTDFIFEVLNEFEECPTTSFSISERSLSLSPELSAKLKRGVFSLVLSPPSNFLISDNYDLTFSFSKEKEMSFHFLNQFKSLSTSNQFWLTPLNLQPNFKVFQLEQGVFKSLAFFFSILNLIVTSFVPPFLVFYSGFFFLHFLTSQYELEDGEQETDFLKGALLSPQFNQRRVKDILGVESLLPELSQIFKSFSSSDFTSLSSLNSYLFVGPPGTGKTKLAQAIAGEAGIPFIGVSASVFLSRSSEASKKLRDLFALTKKCSPCVLFIDEIDAFGQTRHGLISNEGSRFDLETNVHKETSGFDSFVKLQALTEFLVQLDGISSKEKVLVIAATNSLNLDPALTRPGRFNRFLNLGLPNFDLRKRILKFHSTHLGFDKSISWEWLAHATENLSGASLQTIVNESALKVIAVQGVEHTLETLEFGIDRVTGCSSLSSLLGFSNIAIYQNPFLFLKKAYFQTSQTLISLFLESSINYSKVKLSSPSRIPSSDLNYEQILVRGTHQATLLATYKTKLSYLLTSVLSDQFFLSQFQTIKRKQLLSWLSLNSVDSFDEAVLLVQTLVQKWFLFSATDFCRSTQFSLKSLPNLETALTDLSSLSLQANQFDLFFFDENWQPFERSNEQVKVQPDLYYSMLKGNTSNNFWLSNQEILLREILLEAQQRAALNLCENDFLLHTLAGILVNRQFLRPGELEFILKKFYLVYLANHLRSFYCFLVFYFEVL